MKKIFILFVFVCSSSLAQADLRNWFFEFYLIPSTCQSEWKNDEGEITGRSESVATGVYNADFSEFTITTKWTNIFPKREFFKTVLVWKKEGDKIVGVLKSSAGDQTKLILREVDGVTVEIESIVKGKPHCLSKIRKLPEDRLEFTDVIFDQASGKTISAVSIATRLDER